MTAAILSRRRHFITQVATWFGVGLLALTGCRSRGEPGGASHASVIIKDKSDAQIRQAAAAVFGEDGYSAAGVGPNYLVFQKPGSRRDAVKWGGLLTGEGVVIRAKLIMTSLADDSRLLQLDMFVVRGAGDSFFEDESRMMVANKLPYQRMLNDIKKRVEKS